MRKLWTVFFIPISVAMFLAWFVGPGARAAPWIAGSIGSRLSEPSLIVKVHKKHCIKVFACDYFAPATSCSTPPCCKKGHWEKSCEKQTPSDIRLKRDIIQVARLDNGIGLYRYRYKWSDQVYVGVMAQDVASIVPDAVAQGPDGYLRVDYSRLGLHLMTWNEWVASGGAKGLAHANTH